MIYYMVEKAPNDIERVIDNFKYATNFVPLLLVVLIILFVVIVLYIDKIHYFLSIFLGLFPKAWRQTQKQRISRKISADVIKSTKEAHKEFKELLPHDIEIKWEKSDGISRETFLKSNKVVVCIKDEQDENLLIVKTVYDYVKCSLLNDERSSVDENIVIASAVTMTRKFLKKAYSKGITSFFNKLVTKEINGDIELKSLIDLMIEVDESGFFTNVFINELKKSAVNMVGRTQNAVFIDETKELVKFLYNIATRENGEYSDLQFSKRFYKVGIILVAKIDTLKKAGYLPYVKRYEQYVLDGFDGIYLFARESRTRQIDNVFNEIRQKISFIRHKVSYFDGQTAEGIKVKGKCYYIEAEKVSD